jgi:hypothetical protein
LGNGLYISDDNGVTANYDSTGASLVMASTYIRFNDTYEFTLSFDCGDGWCSLVDSICERLKGSGAKIRQVKEKFGGLRFSVDFEKEEDSNFINQIEKESFKICENCGTKENVTVKGGWIKTLCKDCRENLYKRNNYAR